MGWRSAPDGGQLAQRRADIEEDLDLRQWLTGYATHRDLVSAVDEAARRAQSVARLEDALSRLPGP